MISIDERRETQRRDTVGRNKIVAVVLRVVCQVLTQDITHAKSTESLVRHTSRWTRVDATNSHLVLRRQYHDVLESAKVTLEIELRSRVGEGTRVVIDLPVSKEAVLEMNEE